MSNTDGSPEVWITPSGKATELHFTGQVRYESNDGEDYSWYADFPGQRHPAGYEMTVAGQPFDVVAEFVVSPTGGWGYYDAIVDLLIHEGWTPPPLTEAEMAECEHGLSLALCHGPGHYPMD